MSFKLYARWGRRTTVGLKLSWLESDRPQDYCGQISLKLDEQCPSYDV